MFKKIFLFMLLVWPFEMILAQRISSMEVGVVPNRTTSSDTTNQASDKVTLISHMVCNSYQDIDFLHIWIGTSEGASDIFQSITYMAKINNNYYTQQDGLVFKVEADKIVHAIGLNIPLVKIFGNYISVQATYKNGKKSNVLTKQYKN
jgi:hypothetical protein